MISNKMAATLLYAYPSLAGLIRSYRKRLEYLFGFDYNSRGLEVTYIYNKIVETADMIESLTTLRNVMSTALGLLSKEQREVIEGLYFKELSREKLAVKLNITTVKLKSRKDAAFKKLRTYIEILGFGEEKLIKCFDDEILFIDCAEKVSECYRTAEHFKGKGENDGQAKE